MLGFLIVPRHIPPNFNFIKDKSSKLFQPKAHTFLNITSISSLQLFLSPREAKVGNLHFSLLSCYLEILIQHFSAGPDLLLWPWEVFFLSSELSTFELFYYMMGEKSWIGFLSMVLLEGPASGWVVEKVVSKGGQPLSHNCFICAKWFF